MVLALQQVTIGAKIPSKQTKKDKNKKILYISKYIIFEEVRSFWRCSLLPALRLSGLEHKQGSIVLSYLQKNSFSQPRREHSQEPPNINY